eukprot:TRINITY_DN641_c1_g1_i1.p1 TRINITY_DN641_c1_g1~~TRINITY_DN641_c1_g1_i1.p1  ORF type:complete len:428 (+),score=80.81 TRINITY_DN641_c1_g1_i1:39-1322(+)
MGRQVGHYELGKTLGKGSFSKVKLGFDRKTGGEVAIKVIHKERMAQEDLQEQVLREIGVTKLLRHENVVRVYEVFQTPKYLYLVMELVTGGMLYTKLVEAGRFKDDEARGYFQQLVLGVKYCHNQGIAHRDLKLENLLLDGDNVLKISDFGLSNLQPTSQDEGDTLLRTVCGTPNYVAPEVLNANQQGYNGLAADVWSCGILLYVMLAGMLPFEHGDIDVLFKLIETCDYLTPQWFTPEASDLISKLLMKNPRARYTMDDVITHRWFQVNFDSSRLDATSVPVIKGEASIDTVDELDSSGYSSLQGSPTSSTTRRLSTPLDWRQSSQPKTLMGSMVLDTPIEPTFSKLCGTLFDLDAHPDRKPGTYEMKGYTTRCRHGKMLAYSTICLETNTGKTLLEVRFVRGTPQDFDDFFFTLRSRMEEGALAQ